MYFIIFDIIVFNHIQVLLFWFHHSDLKIFDLIIFDLIVFDLIFFDLITFDLINFDLITFDLINFDIIIFDLISPPQFFVLLWQPHHSFLYDASANKMQKLLEKLQKQFQTCLLKSILIKDYVYRKIFWSKIILIEIYLALKLIISKLLCLKLF